MMFGTHVLDARDTPTDNMGGVGGAMGCGEFALLRQRALGSAQGREQLLLWWVRKGVPA
jgi:hypothetical protein